MLESGTFGSVRGVPGNGYPYRNPRPIAARGRFLGERPVYPWNLTFDHAAEKAGDGDGRSRAATNDRQRIPPERVHPKATNWRCRPNAGTHG